MGTRAWRAAPAPGSELRVGLGAPGAQVGTGEGEGSAEGAMLGDSAGEGGGVVPTPRPRVGAQVDGFPWMTQPPTHWNFLF